MPIEAIFKTLTAVIIVRTVIEKILSTGHRVLYDPQRFYVGIVGDLHMYFSWICIFLMMSVPVAAFLGVRCRDALKLTLLGFCVTPFVPLIDFAATGGVGDVIRYFRDFQTFAYNYVNLFNPFAAAKGVTAGVRAEVLTVFFGSFILSYFGFRRGLVRSFLLSLSLYTIIYFYGYLLPIHDFLKIDLMSMSHRSAAGIEETQQLFFAYLGPFLLGVLGVAAVLTIRERAGRVIVALLYPSRLCFYLFLLAFGLLFAAHETGKYPGILNLPDLLKALCAAYSITLLFVYAKLLNDVHDLAIDRISNRRRPLPEGLLGQGDAEGLAFVCLLLSGVLAIPAQRDFFYFWTCLWGLSYLYSAPPFRLRRFWPLGPMIIAGIGLFVFLAGTALARPNDFFAAIVHKEVVAYVYCACLCLGQLKDAKDGEGDRAGGVFNLFGRVPFPRALALVCVAGFLASILLILKVLNLINAVTMALAVLYGAVSSAIILKSRTIAALDTLLPLSFPFLLLLGAAWLI